MAKKPQVVLLHARALNIKLPFLSETSVARLLAKIWKLKDGFQVQLNSPKAKLYKNMPPFLCHHFIDNIFSGS